MARWRAQSWLLLCTFLLRCSDRQLLDFFLAMAETESSGTPLYMNIAFLYSLWTQLQGTAISGQKIAVKLALHYSFPLFSTFSNGQLPDFLFFFGDGDDQIQGKST